MTPGLEIPTPKEIKDQLGRMLAATRFRNATNRADFLALVVRRALQGKKTTGRIIAEQLFQEKPDYYVRVTASHLRKSLKEYQAEEGREDLVVIALPKPPKSQRVKLPEGEAYTPRFSYNSAHAVGQEFELGEFHRLRATIEDDFKAHDHYREVLKIAPCHIGANIGSVEVWIGLAGWDSMWGPPSDPNKSIFAAAEILDEIHPFASDSWRLHAAGGFMLMANGDLQHAQKAFTDALALDRSSTESYPAYFHFLIAAGKADEGLRLAKNYLDAHVADTGAHVTYALALMKAKRTDEALTILEKAFSRDRGHKRLHLFLAQIYMARYRPAEALRHLEYLHDLVDSGTFTLILGRCKHLIEAWPDTIKREWAGRGPLITNKHSSLFLTEE